MISTIYVCPICSLPLEEVRSRVIINDVLYWRCPTLIFDKSEFLFDPQSSFTVFNISIYIDDILVFIDGKQNCNNTMFYDLNDRLFFKTHYMSPEDSVSFIRANLHVLLIFQ